MKRPQVFGYRVRDETEDWICWNGGKGEDLQLAYLLPCSKWPVDSQGMPGGVGGWDKAMSCWGGSLKGKIHEIPWRRGGG